MEYSQIIYEVADSIATITLSRPERMNAFTDAMMREVIDACRRVTGHAIPTVEAARRPGDPPRLFADPTSIRRDLGWTARHDDLDGIVRTAWDWMRAHPAGYA